jgi:hypothetical protein
MERVAAYCLALIGVVALWVAPAVRSRQLVEAPIIPRPGAVQ